MRSAHVVFPNTCYNQPKTSQVKSKWSQDAEMSSCGAEFTVNSPTLRSWKHWIVSCSCVKEHSALFLAFYFCHSNVSVRISVPQKGYDDLQSIVPTCQQQSDFAMATQKMSKATVLQKSENIHYLFIFPCHMSLLWKGKAQWLVCVFAAIDYIQFLHKEKKKQEEDVSTLRKEVMALKIMKTWVVGYIKGGQKHLNCLSGQM